MGVVRGALVRHATPCRGGFCSSVDREPLFDRCQAILNSRLSVAASEGVIISAGQEGKVKTALQMIGIIALLVGYPYHLSYFGFDLGVVDCMMVGRALVYLSLVFSVASAAQYIRLFAAAVEAKEEKRHDRGGDLGDPHQDRSGKLP